MWEVIYSGMSACQSVRPSVSQYTPLSVRLSIHLFLHAFVCSFVRFFVRLHDNLHGVEAGISMSRKTKTEYLRVAIPLTHSRFNIFVMLEKTLN